MARLDAQRAVGAAYGWPADLSDDEILKRLLEFNLIRSARQEPATNQVAADSKEEPV